MGQPPDDLAELLYAPDDVTPGNRGDDLLSQLAGESIDRMMSGDEFEPIVNPVEKLTNQLDTFFEELQHRRQMKSVAPHALGAPASARQGAPAPAAPPAPVAAPGETVAPREEQFEVPAEPRAAHDDEPAAAAFGSDVPTPAARAMLVDFEESDRTPAYLRPLDWMAAPIEAMSATGRLAVSLTAVASFLTACGTLAYVLVLRHSQ